MIRRVAARCVGLGVVIAWVVGASQALDGALEAIASCAPIAFVVGGGFRDGLRYPVGNVAAVWASVGAVCAGIWVASQVARESDSPAEILFSVLGFGAVTALVSVLLALLGAFTAKAFQAERGEPATPAVPLDAERQTVLATPQANLPPYAGVFGAPLRRESPGFASRRANVACGAALAGVAVVFLAWAIDAGADGDGLLLVARYVSGAALCTLGAIRYLVWNGRPPKVVDTITFGTLALFVGLLVA